MLDGSLFDLDGALWAAAPRICAAWNLAARGSGTAPPAVKAFRAIPDALERMSPF